ncbi:TPA: hypothetical protein RVR73_003055 [Aeromonas hydrophila]|nr:hypothetical protein [Aeromonas hydrophila]
MKALMLSAIVAISFTYNNLAVATTKTLTGIMHVSGEIVEAPCGVNVDFTKLHLTCWVQNRNVHRRVNVTQLKAKPQKYILFEKGTAIAYVGKSGTALVYSVRYH